MGFKTRHWTWFASESDEIVKRTEDQLMWSAAPFCPECGKKTEWDVFQTDQDRMGNDIYGGCFECPSCHIHTKIVEVDHRDYIEDEMGFD